MTRRAGFTLIEVLFVITIISILIGLILPALHSSRESARRISCVNNLRQIVLAVHNYQESHDVLPPGVVNRTGPVHNVRDGLHLGWLTQLLPMLEQHRLYEAIDPDLSVYDPANSTASMTQINSLLCPSDPRPNTPAAQGVSSYAGCHHDVEAPIDATNHGVFYLNSRVSFDAITDGASFTIFLGEKTVGPGDLGWMSGTRATLRNTGARINAPSEPGDDLVGGFSSFHPGGANFALGDGSVRFLSDRIDPAVYRRLGHRADGEPISADALNP